MSWYANKAGLWRYRVGDFRVICEIQDDLLVLAITIGRREYDVEQKIPTKAANKQCSNTLPASLPFSKFFGGYKNGCNL